MCVWPQAINYKQSSPTRRFKSMTQAGDSVAAYIGLKPFARIRLEAEAYDPALQQLLRKLLDDTRASSPGDLELRDGLCGIELVRVAYNDKVVLSKADPLVDTYVMVRNVVGEHAAHGPHLLWVSSEQSADGLAVVGPFKFKVCAPVSPSQAGSRSDDRLRLVQDKVVLESGVSVGGHYRYAVQQQPYKLLPNAYYGLLPASDAIFIKLVVHAGTLSSRSLAQAQKVGELLI